MDIERWGIIFLGIIIGVLITAIVILCVYGFYPIQISQETANEICYNFTGVDGVVGSSNTCDRHGKLVCEVPSFDATQNIIIKSNSEEN